MADEEEDEGAEEGEEKEGGGGGGKSKLILLIVLGLVVIGASVGGTLLVLSMLKEEPVLEEGMEEGMEGEAAMEEEVKKPAIYYPLKPSIIVNFEARGRQRFMQADLTFLIRDDDVIAAIELHMPMIRNALVLLMGGQLYEDVQTAEGKELMRVQCLQEVQRLLEQEIGKPGVEQVLFTNLVMQ